MENSIDFNNLWKRQSIPTANKKEVFEKLKKLKRSSIRRLIFLNVTLLATLAVLILVWIYFQPEMLSTKIGLLLTIAAIVISIVANNMAAPLYRHTEETDSNADYLKALLQIKQKEQHLQTKIMSLYFILLSLGIGLYMIEYVWRMSLMWGVITYGLAGVWIAFNWFVLRPKIVKKNNKKIDSLIQQLEKLNSQCSDE